LYAWLKEVDPVDAPHTPMGSPELGSETNIGFRLHIMPSVDVATSDVTVVIVPAILGIVWNEIQLPNFLPVAQLVYEEGAFKKELVRNEHSHWCLVMYVMK
jgi:hypothetical protein